MEKLTSILRGIRNKFILLGIRIGEFYKNHKIAAPVASLFIVSAIVFSVVVLAEGDVISEADVASASISVDKKSLTKNEDKELDEKALNFTTINYNLSYTLSSGNICNSGNDEPNKVVDKVVIKATINENDQAMFNLSDETTTPTISNNGKQIDILVTNVQLCSGHTQVIPLMVLNSENGKTISPNVTIKAGSSASEISVETATGGTKEITTLATKNVDLVATVQEGISKKVSDSKRAGKFGILLGFKTNDGSAFDGIEGKYINNLNSIYLDAKLGDSKLGLISAASQTKEEASDNDDFGVYTASKKLFSTLKMPDLSSTSGYISKLAKEKTAVTSNETITNEVEFLNLEDLEFEYIKDPSKLDLYLDSSRANADGWKDYKVITPSSDAAPQVDSKGNKYYTVEYEVDNVKFKRKIKLVDSSSDKYKLVGPKTMIVRDVDLEQKVVNIPYNLIKITNEALEDGTTSSTVQEIEDTRFKFCNLSDSDCSNILSYSDIEQPGEYKQVFMVTSTLEDGTEKTEEISRTIIVVGTNEELRKNAKRVETPEITTSDLTISEGYTDYEDKVCAGIENCKVTYNGNESLDVSSSGKSYNSNIIISTDYYEIVISRKINVTEALYEMIIDNLKYNGEFNYVKKEGSEIYAVGSYFVTTDSYDANETRNICLYAKGSKEDNFSSSYCITDTESSSTGTNTSQTNLYVVENNNQVLVDSSKKSSNELKGDYYTAAMEEEIELENVFNYGYDADDNIKAFEFTIPVSDEYIRFISYEDDSEIGYEIRKADSGRENTVDSESEIKPEISIVYMVNDKVVEEGTNGINKIIVKVEKTNVEPGSTIYLRTKYKVKTSNTLVDKSFNFSNMSFSGTTSSNTISANTTFNVKKGLSDTEKIYITPYKVRSTGKYGKLDPTDENAKNLREVDDLTFDASKNDVYTGAIYTDVVSPAMKLYSNAFGYNVISTLDLKVTLPNGINYVYNKNHNKVEPNVSYSNGNTILTYTYTGVEPNTWIEPLYFDFNIDVTAKTNNLEIIVETGDFIDDTIKNDVSSSDKYKTLKQKLKIQNTLDISYGQYLYDSSNSHYISNVDKNENFIQSIKLHNNSDETKNNVYAYAIIPNNINDNEQKFSGTFEMEFQTADAELQCTNSLSADNLTKPALAKVDSNWNSCDSYKNEDGKYSNITGIRIRYDSIKSNDDKVANILYSIKDNNADDKYDFEAYLDYENAAYVDFRKLSLEVISKKITGTVFEDFVVNGIMDDNEKNIEGVILKLYDSNTNELVQTTTSNKKGIYTFSGLVEGNYYVVAEFNTDKYGLTTEPSRDYYDKTRMSVFHQGSDIVEDIDVDTSANLNEEEVTSEQNTDQTVSENNNTTNQTSSNAIVRTDNIEITSETRIHRYVNLGLSLKKKFKAKITKYISKAVVTDALGVKTTKDYGNAKIAKLDVRDMNKVKIKVVYTLELQNIMYYPGYITKVIEVVPDGMSFNKSYEENKGWKLNESGVLENETLSETLLNEKDKKYLTVAFDITSKEAGSFVNVASIDGLQILGGGTSE